MTEQARSRAPDGPRKFPHEFVPSIDQPEACVGCGLARDLHTPPDVLASVMQERDWAQAALREAMELLDDCHAYLCDVPDPEDGGSYEAQELRHRIHKFATDQ